MVVDSLATDTQLCWRVGGRTAKVVPRSRTAKGPSRDAHIMIPAIGSGNIKYRWRQRVTSPIKRGCPLAALVCTVQAIPSLGSLWWRDKIAVSLRFSINRGVQCGLTCLIKRSTIISPESCLQ